MARASSASPGRPRTARSDWNSRFPKATSHPPVAEARGTPPGREPDGLQAFLVDCVAATAAELGKPVEDFPAAVSVEWGEHPEFRLIDDGRARLFVEQGSDWWQVRYQIAHEVFHGFFTRPQRFHWTHEMFAVEAALSAMRRIGEDDYVASAEARLTSEAESLSLEQMLTTPLSDSEYPEGLYGRAFLTGRALIDAVGWPSLKRLVHAVDADGQPSVAAWLSTLDDRERRAAIGVLQRDSG